MDAGARPAWARVVFAPARIVAVSLAVGIALGDHVGAPRPLWGAVAVVAGLTAWWTARAGRGRAAALALLWLCVGGSLAVPARDAPVFPRFLLGRRAPLRFEGRVSAPARRSQGRTELCLEGVRVRVGASWHPVSARVRLVVRGLVYRVGIGDVVVGRARFRRPRVLTNPGAPDMSRRLRYRGIAVAAYVGHAAALTRRSDAAGRGIRAALDRWRARTAMLLGDGRLGEGSLLAAFFLGDRGRLDRRDRESFAVAGLSHTLAVSGQHLAVIALLLFRLVAWLLARWEWLAVRVAPRRPAAALTLVAATAYTLMVGAPYSTLRALALVALLLGGAILARPTVRTDAIWLAVAAILVASPGGLFDVGFQLSVLAVFGLIVVAPGLRAWLAPRRADDPPGAPPPLPRRLWWWMAGLLAATVGASLVTAPLVAHYFHLFTPLGLVGTLLVVPLLELWILPFSLAAVLLPPLGGALWAVAEAGAVGVRAALDAVGSLDALATMVRPPTWLQVGLLTLGAFLLARWRRRWARRLLVAIGGAVLLTFAVGYLTSHLGAEVRITFLSVGHGDAAVVQLPGGRTLLIDGGGAIHGEDHVGRALVAPALRALGVTGLDAVVISHLHPDHVRGLAHVVRSFPVREIWYSGRPYGRAGAELRAAVRSRRIRERIFRAGAPAVRFGAAEVIVLHPLLDEGSPEPYFHELDENDNSLVIQVRLGRFRALFPGDLESEGERVLLESGRPLRSVVLKAPHHGSRTSSTAAFLAAVRPRVVVYSVGEDSQFGFPHPGPVARARRLGARVFRTDRDGAVVVRSDGETLRVVGLRSGREWEGTLQPQRRSDKRQDATAPGPPGQAPGRHGPGPPG